jgi:predicted RNase H-like nuclease (RuvC/YqgF family)
LGAKGRLAILGASLLWVIASWMNVHGEGAGEGEEMQRLKQRAAHLEEAVRELREENSMLMENLFHCMEENKELSRDVQGVPQEPAGSRLRLSLVRQIEKVLRTEKDLGFLMELDSQELELLLDLIQRGSV